VTFELQKDARETDLRLSFLLWISALYLPELWICNLSFRRQSGFPVPAIYHIRLIRCRTRNAYLTSHLG